MSEIEGIARTIAALAAPGMKPKQLLSAVRKKHRSATKKDLSRAAFLAAIVSADSDPDKAARIHDVALASRTSVIDEDEGVATAPKVRKSKAP